MTKKLTNEYWRNKRQQDEIRLAITEAIPVGVYYTNLIIVMAELVSRFVQIAYKEAVFKWPPDNYQEAEDDGK